MAIISDGVMTFAGGSDSRWSLLMVIGLFCFCTTCISDVRTSKTPAIFGAVVNITYKDPQTGEPTFERSEIGRYGGLDAPEPEYGLVVHVRTVHNRRDACYPLLNAVSERWIALVERGGCKFREKVYNSVIYANASALVVYNNQGDDIVYMDHKVKGIVSIFITQTQGQHIVRLVDNGTRVMMQITVGGKYKNSFAHINKTSVLFVSISFIVLMIISLAWLVFYYIQRFRYAHAKERLSKRLINAAKKAITKMPMRTLKNGDPELDAEFDQCAVCIESYKVSDVIRTLPCRHVFHKSCVDPWLIEQRSCPMCKLDILKAYGLQMTTTRPSLGGFEFDDNNMVTGAERLDLHQTPMMAHSESGVVEVVQFHPAEVEYHDPGCEEVGMTDDRTAEQLSPKDDLSHAMIKATKQTVPRNGVVLVNTMAPCGSLESVRSTESDSNELQSLMPQSKKGQRPEVNGKTTPPNS